jgi:hypothetical protein
MRPRFAPIAPSHYISAAMNPNLDPQDRADLARFLREAIEADRFPLSPRVRRLRELLVKVDRAPAPAVTPYPAPKPPGQPSMVLAKGKRRR